MVKKVKKAVIAAAGLGSRMFPFSKVESKLMIPILNKPVVIYLLEELAASGIKEVIITSDHVSTLKRFFKEDKGLNKLLKRLKKDNLIEKLRHIEYLCNVDVIKQDQPYGWMHEVWHAKSLLKNEPFVVCFSDILFTGDIPATKQLIDSFYQNKKNIWSTARFVFMPSIFDMLKKENFVLGQDTVDIDIFEKLRERNEVISMNINGIMHNTGDPLSYMKTQSYFGLQDPEIGAEYKAYLQGLLK